MADQAPYPGRLGAKATAKLQRAAAKAQAKADRAAEREKARIEKANAKALAKTEEDKILKDLGTSLDTHNCSATFACGGSLPLKRLMGGNLDVGFVDKQSGEHANEKTHEDATASQDVKSESTDAEPNTSEQTGKDPQTTTIDPIQIRFGQSGKGYRAVFSAGGIFHHDLEQLVLACQPASFGRNGEAVQDEAYRKAGKLDRDEFATSFCPYGSGIVDVISQLLVPQTAHDKHSRSIKAELYKLNVYSAPAGKFKSHVDTPRSESQIGSLVVSLPASHQGGELVVGSAGKEMMFDWSNDIIATESNAAIEWAAFYSDCEHEVYEVTSGHRITLTYNLYVTRGLGHLAGSAPALDPQQLPLYQVLYSALDSPGFLRRGRVLAIWLTHSYAHTNKHVNFLPNSLKGADMSIYTTAQALGLMCLVVPTMTLDYGYYGEGPTHLFEPRFRGFNESGSGGFCLDEGGPYWGSEMPEGKVTWLNPEIGAAEKKTAKKDVKGSDEAKSKSKPTFKEGQMAYMTYGNEPGIGIEDSRAVMLIRIPPFSERFSGKDAPAQFWEGIKRDPGDYDDYDYDEDDEDFDEDDYDEDDYDEEEEEEDEESSSEGDGDDDEEMTED